MLNYNYDHNIDHKIGIYEVQVWISWTEYVNTLERDFQISEQYLIHIVLY